MKRTDSPALAALLTAIAYAVFILHLLHARGGDISIFVVAGGGGVDPQKVPPGLTVIPGIGGYDGVAFYRLALDPFTRVQTAYGVSLDNPAYRHQRIGYPLVVWALSLGRARIVPRVMVGVNFAALVIMGALGAMLARQYGHHALLGLLFPLFPGFAISLSRDLSEIVASTCALAAIVAMGSRRFRWAAFFLSYAVLTRETTLIVAMALAVSYAYQRRFPAVTFVAPFLTFTVWQSILAFIWGAPGVKAGSPDLTMPFVEYARFFAASSSRRLHVQRVYFAECVFLAAVLIAVVLVWMRSRATLEWRVAWVGTLALAATLPHASWGEDFAFLRIVADWFVMSGVLILSARTAVTPGVILLMTLGVWYYVADWIVARG